MPGSFPHSSGAGLLRALRPGRGARHVHCPACGRPVAPATAVHVRGDSFHAECALYRRPARQAAA